MRRWAHPLVAFLLAACGPKATGTSGGDGGGSSAGGSAASAGSEGATDGSATVASDTGMEGRVVYRARCADPGSGLGNFLFVITKQYLDADYCIRIFFHYPSFNNSGELGIEFPPDPNWNVDRPQVLPSGDCIADSEDYLDVLAASGTVWWDEAMSFVDVDVTLTLPPDPRWPDTDVLFVEGLPIQDRDQCPGIPTGTSGG